MQLDQARSSCCYVVHLHLRISKKQWVAKFVKIRFTKLLRRHSASANTRPSFPANEPPPHQQRPLSKTPGNKYPSTPSSRLHTLVDEVREQDEPEPQPLPAEGIGLDGFDQTPSILPPSAQPPVQAPLRPVLTIESPSPPTTRVAATTFNPVGFQTALPTPATSSHPAEGTPSQEYPSTTKVPQPIATPLSFNGIDEPGEHIQDYFGAAVPDSAVGMARRKVWIKRPGASATLVQVAQDDMVDDVRDMVLRKYANSLGRTFDAPDVTIRINPRERTQQVAERMLSPEESICRILDAYFPGGQSVEEALLIDVPHKRSPRPSPRPADPMTHYFDDSRPVENEGDYFPPMPAVPPGPPQSIDGRPPLHLPFHAHSLAILESGQLAPLPSPRERKAHHRPKYGRQHTSSPTIINTNATQHNTNRRPLIDSALNHANHVPSPPPLPRALAVEGSTKAASVKASTPPLDRVTSPRPAKKTRQQKPVAGDAQRPGPDGRKNSDKQPNYAFLEGIVPPINVLIVEDNPINLRLLEMFAKRLKVRWQTAMNGRDAVVKWRTGGFHLVLMDIQLPIMSGIEATKEIRRLERVNGIGVFAKSEGEDRPMMNNGVEADADGNGLDLAYVESAKDGDMLNLDGIFKSPVIIVALTASSLQSDRHEALAAGCNDFLTKVHLYPLLTSSLLLSEMTFLSKQSLSSLTRPLFPHPTPLLPHQSQQS